MYISCMELLGDTLQIRHESMTMGISTCARVAMLGLAKPITPPCKVYFTKRLRLEVCFDPWHGTPDVFLFCRQLPWSWQLRFSIVDQTKRR